MEVDRRFDDVDRRFDEFDEFGTTMRAGFEVVDARSTRIEATMKEGFDRVDDKFERLYALVVAVGGGLVGTLIAAIVAIVISHM